MQNPHETVIDTASNSFKADVCMRSFKATSLRLKCAIQRDIRASSGNDDSGMGEAETGGFLKYCIDPGGELKDRVLPPPTFCTRTFDGEVLSNESSIKETLREKAEKLIKKHGDEGGKKGRHADGGGAAAAPASSGKKKGKKGKGKGKGKGKEKGKEKEGDDTSPSSSSSASAASSPASCGGGSGGESGKGKRKASGSDDANGGPQRKGQGNAKKRRKADK